MVRESGKSILAAWYDDDDDDMSCEIENKCF